MESIQTSRQADRKRRNQKPRVLFSCTSCREKKLKCDRRQPCNNCLNQSRDRSCRYLVERSDHEESQTIQSRMQHVEKRLRSLEKTLQNREFSNAVENKLISVSPEDSHTRNAVDAIVSKEANESLSSGLFRHSRQMEYENFQFVNPSHWRSIMYHAVCATPQNIPPVKPKISYMNRPTNCEAVDTILPNKRLPSILKLALQDPSFSEDLRKGQKCRSSSQCCPHGTQLKR